MKASVIIPAAGLGLRLGGPVPKQFLTLNGKPILHHTLQVFEQCGVVDTIVLTVPEKEVEAIRGQWRPPAGIHGQVVAGGKQRQDSVYNGFQALDPAPDIVLVHDGVRPFITPALIAEVVRSAREWGAVITAVPVNDTIKKADTRGIVERTVDRDGLWRVQTPQGFHYTLLAEALERARRDGFYGTDESSLVERLGHEVKIVEGSELNIKITRADDLVLGETIAGRLKSSS